MASVGQKALWWAADYAWAGLAWLATIGAPDDPAVYAEGNKRPVVVLPGVFENWKFTRPLIQGLHDAGHPVYVITELGYNRRPLAAGASLLLDHLRRHQLSGVVLVGHSKGGLIGKLALLRDTEERITALITLCAPFHGSSRAQLLPLPSVVPLTPADELIRTLDEQQKANDRITSISVRYDEHVPEGSHLAGAKNVLLPLTGHFRLVGHPRSLATVRAEIDALD
jgi:pimeloyl-ACP methyl ester carboxylesterase